jgi:hypothetical protein
MLQLRDTLRNGFVLFACFVVLAFAAQAKLSQYRQPGVASRDLSASKLISTAEPEAKNLAAIPATPVLSLFSVVALCCAVCVFACRTAFRRAELALALHALSRAVGIARFDRPPPMLLWHSRT